MTNEMPEMSNKKNELLPYQRLSALKHGHAKHNGTLKSSPTYQSWLSMKTRCTAKHRDTSSKYINRGISMCERWNDFSNFLADMGERPDGKTLDRKDNALGYFPENCQWSDAVTQARNRRSTKLDYIKALDIAKRMLGGEKAAVIAKEYGVSENSVREIHKGRTWKDAHNDARNT